MKKIIAKWEPELFAYTLMPVPNGCDIQICEPIVEPDANIKCIRCGKHLIARDGYVSKQFCDPRGFGYIECAECYKTVEV